MAENTHVIVGDNAHFKLSVNISILSVSISCTEQIADVYLYQV
jgi:hypothetical protein